MKFILLLFFIGSCLVKPTRAQQDFGSGFHGLESYVKQVLETFEVPGVAIGVVKDGKVILTRGYGVRKLGYPQKVDAHTIFPIASNSKAFTATALALLVEDGRLNWDDPVIKYLPEFRLANPYVTEHITVKDLLVHRSGIAPYAGDLMQFPPSTFTRKQLVYKLRYLPLSTSFRSSYAYDNVLYLVAAEVIKSVSGMDWEDFVRERIFKVVGMKESHSRISEFKMIENRAASHAHVKGVLKYLEHFDEQSLGDISNPAGGITSNVADMTRWLITQLDSGRTPSGKQLFPPSTTKALWKGVTPMPTYKVKPWIAPAQTDLNSYALGFYIYTYRGEKIVAHGGKLDGFVSYVSMIPRLNAGVVVLTNQESTNAYRAIVNKIVDHLIGATPFNWIQGYRKEEDRKFEHIAKIEKQAVSDRIPDSKPDLPLQKYAGSYYDDWYGGITITLEKGKLEMKFDHSPLLIGEMEFWQYNTFIVHWYNRDIKADAYVTYSLDENGDITGIKMKAVSPATDVSYDFRDLNIKPKTYK